MNRRTLLLAALATAAAAEAQNSADTDPAWNQNFRAFIKALNRFIESSNDGFFDSKQWKRVRAAWKDLDRKESCQ